MSELFEGIVCPALPAPIKPVVKALADHLPGNRKPDLAIRTIEDELVVVYVTNGRRGGLFVEQLASIAESLSREFGRTLQVFYDSRTGTRISEAWVSGEMIGSFDEADEIFVRLDEAGEPIRDGPPVRADELDSDEEYQTVVNAIQRGCAAVGFPNVWDPLLDVIGSQ